MTLFCVKMLLIIDVECDLSAVVINSSRLGARMSVWDVDWGEELVKHPLCDVLGGEFHCPCDYCSMLVTVYNKAELRLKHSSIFEPETELCVSRPSGEF